MIQPYPTIQSLEMRPTDGSLRCDQGQAFIFVVRRNWRGPLASERANAEEWRYCGNHVSHDVVLSSLYRDAEESDLNFGVSQHRNRISTYCNWLSFMVIVQLLIAFDFSQIGQSYCISGGPGSGLGSLWRSNNHWALRRGEQWGPASLVKNMCLSLHRITDRDF